MKDALIVIPAKDEESAIGDVLQDIFEHCDYDVLVVDDASNDKTAEVARQYGASVVKHVVNMGAWRATQTGMRYAQKHSYKNVITMDADGQHHANQLSKLIDETHSSADLVIGSCLSRGSMGRHVAWKAFKMISRLNVRDLTSGFRRYNADAVKVLCSKQATMIDYQDIAVLLMLKNVGMTATEVKVDMDERHHGISRIFYSWLAVIQYLIYSSVLSISKAVPMAQRSYHKKLLSGENLE